MNVQHAPQTSHGHHHVQVLHGNFSHHAYEPNNCLHKTRVSQPKGGFVLWLECPTALDSLELMRIAEAQRIYIAPGGIFSVSGKYTHCLRLNCAVPWDARVEAAIAFLGQTVSNLIHARPVVAGIEE